MCRTMTKPTQWAERRRLETHPKTGAAQLVEVRERVQEITVPKYVEVEQPVVKPRVFKLISEGTLLSYGVPPEWIPEVMDATEDTLLEIAGHLPSEAAEALLNLATGIRPPLPAPVVAGTDPFEHPDALRRFRVMKNVEELALALNYPWERWAVFLHPVPARSCSEEFQWSGKGFRFCRHRQDDCCPSSSSISGAHSPRVEAFADNILRAAGECTTLEAAVASAQRAAAWRTYRSSLDERHRATSVRVEHWASRKLRLPLK